jgi:PST family polysaccharide transporter
VPVVEIVAAIYSIDTLGSLATPLGLAKGQSRLLFVRSLQKFAVRVPIIALGLILGGMMGLLYARMTAGVIGVAIDMAMVARLTGISTVEQLRANQRAILATGAMAAAVLALRELALFSGVEHNVALSLAAAVLVGVLAYGATSLLLWLLAGRPCGPESEVMEAGAKLLRMAAARSTGAGH